VIGPTGDEEHMPMEIVSSGRNAGGGKECMQERINRKRNKVGKNKGIFLLVQM
jgi:hypothetical protein